MEDKKGIWQGGTTNTNKISEEEARFWRKMEDYNDNVGLETDFAAEYQSKPEVSIEKEMRDKTPSKPKVSISGMGGRGGPVDAIRSANQKTKELKK